MNTTHTSSSTSPSRDRALVLGGGGSAGNAWEIGVIAGLFDAGVDLRTADLVIGTSAGATVAAQIAGESPDRLLARILDSPPPTRPTGPATGRDTTVGRVANHMETTAAIIAASSDPADMRRRLGAAALELAEGSDGSGSARWRATVAGRLPTTAWPDARMLITVVDARTGEPVLLDRESGVDLVDAIAASTSNGFGVGPYPIGDRAYIDGGWRSVENADLASGYERVVVLSPFGGRSRVPAEWGIHLAAQVDALREGGSRVEAVVPDEASVAAFGGGDMMDLTRRAPSARAGFDQGRALAAGLRVLWS